MCVCQFFTRKPDNVALNTPQAEKPPADGHPRGLVTTRELVSESQWECGSKMESASGGPSRCAVFTATGG